MSPLSTVNSSPKQYVYRHGTQIPLATGNPKDHLRFTDGGIYLPTNHLHLVEAFPSEHSSRYHQHLTLQQAREKVETLTEGRATLISPEQAAYNAFVGQPAEGTLAKTLMTPLHKLADMIAENIVKGYRK
jgi:hypothetical protein